MKNLLYLPALLLTGLVACGQSKPAQPDMPLGFEEYDPVSTLKVPEHKLTHSKYPFIDVHNHQWDMDKANLKPLLAQMDSLNMGIMINLSGRGWGSVAQGTQFFDNALANANKSNAKRLVLFTNLNFDDIGRKGWTEESVALLEADVKKALTGSRFSRIWALITKTNQGTVLRSTTHDWTRSGQNVVNWAYPS